MRHGAIFLCAAILLALAPIQAQGRTVPAVDRPLTLPEGRAEAGLDVSVDLSSGRAGKRVEVGSAYFPDRRDGLSVSYGVNDAFEIGAALNAMWWTDEKGIEIGGVYVYAEWAFLSFLGMEIGLQVPSKLPMDRLVIKRASFLVGLPFKYTLIEGLLAVHARTDLWIGFAKSYYEGDASPPQYTVFQDAGLTVNPLPELFVDVSVGVGKVLRGKDMDVQGLRSSGSATFVPLTVLVGCTVMPSLDIGVSFTLRDVLQEGVNARDVTLTTAFRF